MPNKNTLSSNELMHYGVLSITFKGSIVDIETLAKPIGCKKTCVSEALGINDYR